MKIIFILGSALLLSQPLCAQNEEAKDTLTTQMMMQNLPEVFVKATRPIVKAERGQLVYNMPLLIEKMPADNAYDALTRIPGVNELSSFCLDNRTCRLDENLGQVLHHHLGGKRVFYLFVLSAKGLAQQ